MIIPHFDRCELLKQAVQSVASQTYGGWEVIVVDDGSRKSEWQAIQEIAGEQIRLLQRIDGTKGPSRCRNLGAAAATGDYLLFLDSDDLLAPVCLKQRMTEVDGQPNADLWVFPVELFRDNVGDLKTQWNKMDPQGDDLARFLRSDGPWCVSSPLWRRSSFQKIGGFNERVCYGDDADLHIRALLSGLQVRQFPDATPDVFIRRSETTRITNSSSAEFLDSRLERLEVGTVTLQEGQAMERYHAIWEGQYFVECEFLMFTQDRSAHAMQRVLERWSETYRPDSLRRCLVKFYFAFSFFFLKRCYFLVRIARRMAMLLLPREFFPTNTATASTKENVADKQQFCTSIRRCE